MAKLRRQLKAGWQNVVVRPGPDETYADLDHSVWRSIDWPSMLRTLEIDGGRVNLLDSGGDGPVLLFIHGLSGAWQNWLLNIPHFMGRYRCVAPDLPGFGASELPREPISIRGYGHTVDQICDVLGIERVTVIGNSMGGFIGAELAISFPTRVDKLVLVSAAGLAIEHQRRQPLMTLARLASIGGERQVARANDMVVRRRRARRAAMQLVFRYPEKLSAPLAWEMVQGTNKPGFLPGLEALLSYSFRDRLAKIECPVLIVWGRNDMLVPVEDADLFEQLIGPNARKVIFEDTGHVPMIERPSRFNELVDALLAGERAPEAEVEGVSA